MTETVNKNSKKNAKHTKLPDKTTINLATVDVEKIQAKAVIPGVIAIIAVAAIFAKFGVADRLSAMNAAESEAAAVQAQLDAAHLELSKFEEIKETYGHYTFSGMTNEELKRVDRADVISLIEKIVMPNNMTTSWVVNENILTLTVTGESLEDINKLAGEFEKDERVSYCTVMNAIMEEVRIVNVITEEAPAEAEEAEEAEEAGEAEGEAAEAEPVQREEEIVTTQVHANIVVFLQNPEEEVRA